MQTFNLLHCLRLPCVHYEPHSTLNSLSVLKTFYTGMLYEMFFFFNKTIVIYFINKINGLNLYALACVCECGLLHAEI